MSAKVGWSSFNPSIAYSPVEGYKCIVRSSNYVITRGQYEYPGYIDTRNWVAHLDDDLRVTGMEEIDQEAVRGSVLYPDVRHMEDARLIWHDDGYWQVSGTVREHRKDGVCRIAVDRLDNWRSVERSILPSPALDLRHEKNWMPMEDGRFIYQASPLTIADAQGGTTEIADPSCFSSRMRGGSQAIRMSEGWLALIHEVYHHETGRQYLNRFIYAGDSGSFFSASPLFYFERPTIEFAAGLAVHGDHLVASFGLEDRLAMLGWIPLDGLRHVLAAPL
jgi:predicted GH43/DUF377 family glycosyl hydrolase